MAIILNYFFKGGVIEWLYGLIIGCIYGILPDIDSPSSKIRWLITTTGLFFVVVTLIKKNGFFFEDNIIESLILSSIILMVWVLTSISGFRHRQFFHSFKASLLLSFPFLFFHWTLSVIALLSYNTHLLFDWIFTTTKRKVIN